MSFFGKAETVETLTPVSPAEHLEQIRERRRIAEANFNDAYANVAKHREMLARANGAMEKAKREFHAAEETEANELMRLGLKR
jgi:regulator of PEP synthase PpsR (kinase-PPPase family)